MDSFFFVCMKDYGAREWLKLGAPAEKIIIGMPTYGRTFTLSDLSKFDIGSPANGGGDAGAYTSESGFMAYYEVCIIRTFKTKKNEKRK